MSPGLRVTTGWVLFLVPSVLVVLLLPGSQGDPDIRILEPGEASWFTEPDQRIRGWVSPEDVIWIFDEDDFTNGTFNHVYLDSGNLVFSPVEHFNEDFLAYALDTDTWEVISNGYISVSGSEVRLGCDENDSYPLIATKGALFPMGSDWSGRMILTFGIPDFYTEGFGAGFTPNGTDHYNSTTAVYGDTLGGPQWYHIFVDGEPVTEWKSIGNLMGTLDVEYTFENDTYNVYYDKRHIVTKSGLDHPVRFWLGCPNYGTMVQSSFHEMSVEYIDLWTFAGTWTSPVYDLGGMVDSLRVETNHATTDRPITELRVEFRESVDNRSWSEWNEFGDDLEHGPFIQIRVHMSMDRKRSEDDYVLLRSLILKYTYPLGPVQVQVNNGEWENVTTTEYWSHWVTLTEDWNTIRAAVRDSRGDLAMDSRGVTLDTTPPSGEVGMDVEGEYTNDRNVTFFFKATDKYGVKSVHISLYKDFSTEEVVEPLVDSYPWLLPGGFVKTDVYIRYKDNHGLLSEVFHLVFYYDPWPPTGALSIDYGAPHTDSRNVTLYLDYQDNAGVAEVHLSNDPGFRSYVTVPQGTKRYDGWELTPGPSGRRTVFMRVIDLADNHLVVSDDIELYVPEALGGVAIVGGVNATSTRVLQLAITGPTGFQAMWMQVDEDPTFIRAEWSDLSPYAAISLTEGDGNREVFVRFKDIRGYITLPVSAKVFLDTTPPRITLRLNDGVNITAVNSVSAELTYEDRLEADGMWIGEVDDISKATPVPLETSFMWTFPGVEGTHTLHVWISDGVGNTGRAVDSVFYTVDPPFLKLSITGGNYSNAVDVLEVSVEAIDQHGLPVEVQLGFDGDPPTSAPWLPAVDTMTIDLPPSTTDGTYRVTVRGRNSLGLVSEVVSTEVVLDRTPPSCAILQPKDGSQHRASDPTLDLRFEHDDHVGVALVMYSVDGGEWIVLDGVPEGEPIDLDDFGTHTIAVRVVDKAGNEIIVVSEFKIEKDSSPLFAGAAIGAVVVATVLMVLLRRKRRTGTAE